MAYLRSKSSENRVKAGVGAKTRSAEQFFLFFAGSAEWYFPGGIIAGNGGKQDAAMGATFPSAVLFFF